LSPVTRAAKDGLALISSNAMTVGRASLVLADLARTLALHSDVIALSFEAFRADLSPLGPRAQAATRSVRSRAPRPSPPRPPAGGGRAPPRARPKPRRGS